MYVGVPGTSARFPPSPPCDSVYDLAAIRGAFMRSLPLTFTERITMFQEWILP